MGLMYKREISNVMWSFLEIRSWIEYRRLAFDISRLRFLCFAHSWLPQAVLPGVRGGRAGCAAEKVPIFVDLTVKIW